MFGSVEAFLKGGDDQIEWRVVIGIAVKPSDGTRKTYVGVNGFRVGDVSKDPGNTARVVRVPSPKVFQVPYTHQQPWTVLSHRRLTVRVFDCSGE